jgi:hypothetical protein
MDVVCYGCGTSSDLCPSDHSLVRFFNPDEKCLQRGTDWVFKQSSLRFVFRGLFELAEDRDKWRAVGNMVMRSLAQEN